MPRKVMLIALVLLLVTGSPAAAGPAPRDTVTRQQMRRVLLGTGGMPSGWTLAEQGDDVWGDLFVRGRSCEDIPAEPDYEGLPASVYVSFDNGGHDRNVIEAVGASGSELSHRMIGALREMADHCPVWQNRYSTITATRLPFTLAGDDAIAVLYTVEHHDGGGPPSTEQVLSAIIAYGEVCAVFQQSDPGEIDLAGAETMLTRGARKLQRIR